MRVQITPDVRGEIARQVAPGANRVVPDDAGFVVEDEPKTQRGSVSNKRGREDPRHGQAARPRRIDLQVPFPPAFLETVVSTHLCRHLT